MRADSKVEHMLRKQSAAFVAVALALGLLFVAIGYLLSEVSPFLAAVTAPLASAIVGACIGLSFGSIFDASNVYRIRQIIESALKSPMYADEDSLQHYRTEWHQYFITIRDGEPIWRYRRYHFDMTEIPGKLVYTIRVDNPNGGRPVFYSIEGFVVRDRLIFVQVPQGGREASIIQIFPHGGDHFRNLHAGLSFLETWDGSHSVVPVILSQSVLTESKIDEGTVPLEASNALSERWLKEWNKEDNIDVLSQILGTINE